MEQIKRIGRELKYKGKILDFYEDTMQTPEGHIVKWDYLHHNGAAAVVPVDSDGKIFMVSQYRSGIGRLSLEIPAGCLNPGEDRKTAAARECEEEIGYHCGTIELLLKFHSAFAYCDEYIEIYCATDLVPTKQHLDEDEFLEVKKYDLEELIDMILSGEISDSKTIAAILAYKENYIARKELQCEIYPFGSLEKYKYTVICTFYQGKWVLSRHKNRDTWETQGGHLEEGETPLECATRELFEESGIKDADLYPVCDYWGFNRQSSSKGMVFLAMAHSLGKLPESEMKEIRTFDTLPEKLTYPNVTPKLIAEAEKVLKNKIIG